ncbi:MAG: hypothetical protein WD231_01375 [Candidatus Woykebacteria bacterium]
MDIHAQLAARIIKEQQGIIGPLAMDQAKKVAGLAATSTDDVNIQGNGKEVLEHLVEQYEKFFGRASVEVCKEAIAPLINQIPSGELPDILKS